MFLIQYHNFARWNSQEYKYTVCNLIRLTVKNDIIIIIMITKDNNRRIVISMIDSSRMHFLIIQWIPLNVDMMEPVSFIQSK